MSLIEVSWEPVAMYFPKIIRIIPLGQERRTEDENEKENENKPKAVYLPSALKVAQVQEFLWVVMYRV